MRKLRLGALIILFIIFTSIVFVGAIPLFRVEYEIVSQPSHIRDGDTFEIPHNPAIRLADVSCPETYEYGGSEATYALTQLIDGRTVYIDVDDVYGTGPYGRLICLVYVDFNNTHFLNVNEAMVVLGQATITDYDNQWNPHQWTLFVSKPTTEDVAILLGASAIISLVIVITLNWAYDRSKRKLITFFKSRNASPEKNHF
jgi:hypothetical protein